MKLPSTPSISTIITLLLSVTLLACSSGPNLHTALHQANTNFLNKNFDTAQLNLLKAEALVDDTTPLADKEYLERLKGLNYQELRVMDKAKASLQKALEYSKQMGDTSLIIQNSFNLGLCENTAAEAIALYEYVIELAEKSLPELLPDALEKLSQCYIHAHEFEKAQSALDRASRSARKSAHFQIAFTQCELWLAEDSLHSALSGFRAISPDSCSMVGKMLRARHIYDILFRLGDYRSALAYKDSLQQFTDSIKSIDGANRIRNIEEDYHRAVDTERERFDALLYSSIALVVVVAIIMIFVLKNLRLKRRQVSLTDKIAQLNVKLSELQPKEDHDPSSIDDIDRVQPLIMEKFRLSVEMFRTRPQYDLLKKLNLIRNFDAETKQEVKIVATEIIGRFSDACSSLRQSVPSMTNDDCLLCSMSCCGCSKEVISAILGSSEEAVRRRKSRVKQKLSPDLFAFFFK